MFASRHNSGLKHPPVGIVDVGQFETRWIRAAGPLGMELDICRPIGNSPPPPGGYSPAANDARRRPYQNEHSG